MYVYLHLHIYTLKIRIVIIVKWAQPQRKVKLCLFTMKGRRFTLTRVLLSLCIYHQPSVRTITLYLFHPTVSSFWGLTFIICEWKYDTVQQWALCVFSVENVCEHWPAAEWEEIWMDKVYFVWARWKGVVWQDTEYSVCWCFLYYLEQRLIPFILQIVR